MVMIKSTRSYHHVIIGLIFWFSTCTVTLFLFLILFPWVFLVLLGLCITAPCGCYRRFSAESLSQKIESLEDVLIKETVKSKHQHVSLDLLVNKIQVNAHVLVVKSSLENAKDIFLIHGTAGSCVTFLHMVDTLTEDFNVYVVDLPGFGRSHVVGLDHSTFNSRSTDFYCDFLLEVVKSQGIHQAYFCGHSFGGYLCTLFCHKYPQKSLGLLLISPAGIFPTLGSQGGYWAVVFKFSMLNIGRVFGKVGLVTLTLSTSSIETLYWYYLLAHPHGFGDLVVSDHITLTPMTSYWNRPAFDRLMEIHTPILLIYGENDSIMPPHQGDMIHRMIGCPLHVVKDAGHNPFHTVELGQQVSRLIIQLFSDCNDFYLLDDISVVNQPNSRTGLLLNPHDYKSSFSKSSTLETIDRLYHDVSGGGDQVNVKEWEKIKG